jgi:hypothetical protein
MLAFERAERMFIIRDKRSWMSLLFHPGFFQSGKLGFGEHQAILGRVDEFSSEGRLGIPPLNPL